MDKYKSKLLRKLKVECSEANEELSHVEHLYDNFVSLFVVAVEDYCKKNSLNNPLDKLKDEPEEVKEKPNSLGSGLMGVFRSIVRKSHPDKVGESDVDSYVEATEARKSKDVSKLISVSKDLKVDLNDLTFADIREIESSIKKTSEKIDKIRSSYPWVWYFATDKQKNNLVSRFIDSYDV
jgi:predicted nucleotidyltransferase